MKKLLTLSLLVVSAFLVTLMINNKETGEVTNTSEVDSNYIPQVNRPAAERYHQVRANVETGKVELADVKKARAEVAKWKKNNPTKSGSFIDWQEMGPNNIGGRTRTILFNSADSDKMYTGGVTGGFWKSNDGGGTWNLSENSIEVGCLSVTSMTQTGETIYVGTGSSFEFVYEDTQSNFGTGIFKSTDDGETFSVIPTTTNWNAVNRMATRESRTYAATSNGLFYSDDGNNWSRPSTLSSQSTATEVHVSSSGTVFAAVGSKIYKSTDGDNFTEINLENFVTGSNGNRKIIASCDSQPDVIYMAYLVSNSVCDIDIYRSADNGDNWNRIVNGSISFAPAGSYGGTGCQASYDLALAASPTNPNEIYIGGLTLWKWTSTDGAYQVDNYSGTATDITYVHPDKHVIAYKPGSGDELYIGCDGGIYKTLDASSDYPSFQHSSKNLNTVQYYSIGAGLDGSIIGGAQDNGTTLISYDFNGFRAGQDIAGGDGGYCEISDINPNIMLASSQNGSVRFSSNKGQSFGQFLNGGGGCGTCQLPTGQVACPIDCGKDGPDEDGDGSMDNANFIQSFLLWEDVALFYAIKGEEENISESTLPYHINHNGQTFKVTANLDDVANQKPGHPGITTCFTEGDCNRDISANDLGYGDNYDEYRAEVVNVYNTTDTLIIGFDTIENVIIPSPKFVRSKFVMGNSNGDMWLTYDLHDLATTPFFVHLGRYDYDNNGVPDNNTAGGSIFSMAFSEDGDDVYFGTSNGRVTRVSGLSSEPEEPVTTSLSGGIITGLSVNPNVPTQVIATKGNFGSGDHVFLSINATNANMSFNSIQGDGDAKLPSFPLYDCAIVGSIFSDVVVAGEFGLWHGTTNGVDYTWTQENGKDGSDMVGEIPIERLRFEPMARNNNIPGFKASDYLQCKVLYAGSHGRGAFRTTSFTTNGCEDVVRLDAFQPTDVTNINADYGMNVYPNPASDQITIDFEVETATRVKINLYDIQGKLVKTLKDVEAIGKESVTANIAELSKGNYIVSLQTVNGNTAKQITVVK